MGSFDKLFGLALVVLGTTIAIYYSIWVMLSLVSSPPLLTVYSPSSLKNSRFGTTF